MEEESNVNVRDRERRYQWVITILLTVGMAIIGFLSGMLLQSERVNTQIVTNTVFIEQIQGNIASINIKLDRILFAKGKTNDQ